MASTTAASSPALVTIWRSGSSIEARQDADAEGLVFVLAFQLLDSLLRTDQRHATARNHAFFNGGAGRVQRVFDASLLFLHFDLGGSATP